VTGLPYITFRTIEGLLTPELKAELIARISNASADVIVEDSGADREKVLANTWCIIEEIPFENWGLSGLPGTLERTKKLIDAKKGPFKDV
jgi:phenylpyruvate tautomerase PptA (4-oxalocrotonate tautomerase family)